MRLLRELRPLRQALESWHADGTRVSDWRISWTWERGAEVGVKDAEPANVHSPLTMAEGVSARVFIQWSDGQISSRRAERAELARPGELLSSARAARYEDPDAANFLGPQAWPDVPLFSLATASVAEGVLEPLAALLEVAAKLAAAHRFSTYSGTVSAAHRRAGVLTSRGCEAEGESTAFSYYFWFEGQAGEGWTRREIISPEVARGRLAETCDHVRRLGEREAAFAGGALPVLLHPQVAEAFFTTYFLANLSGERIWNRQSAFRIEHFRERALLFREDLSVRLDPLVPYGAGSYRFTSEGLPARRADYLVSGRLASPMLDLKYARRFGLEPTPPPAGIESVVIEAGATEGPEKILGEMGRGLLVLGVLGLHTQDHTSGEFSLSAPQSLAVGPGRLGGRVRAGLSGNFFECLRSPALRLVRFPGFHMPGLLIPAIVAVD